MQRSNLITFVKEVTISWIAFMEQTQQHWLPDTQISRVSEAHLSFCPVAVHGAEGPSARLTAHQGPGVDMERGGDGRYCEFWVQFETLCFFYLAFSRPSESLTGLGLMYLKVPTLGCFARVCLQCCVPSLSMNSTAMRNAHTHFFGLLLLSWNIANILDPALCDVTKAPKLIQG